MCGVACQLLRSPFACAGCAVGAMSAVSMAGKQITFFLTASPYAGQHVQTVLRLAEAALAQGHRVNLFASADGVYGFLAGHQPVGMPNAEVGLARLIAQGLHVELCGTCLRFRGIAEDQVLEGAVPSTMDRFLAMLETSDVFLTAGA